MKNRFKEIKHYDNITKMRETYFLLEENYIRWIKTIVIMQRKKILLRK